MPNLSLNSRGWGRRFVAPSYGIEWGHPLANGLVGCWALGYQGVQGDRNIAFPGSNNIAWTSATPIVGPLGPGMSFNGTTSLGDGGTSARTNGLTALTVACWCRDTRIGSAIPNGPILSKRDASGGALSVGWYASFTGGTASRSLGFAAAYSTTDLFAVAQFTASSSPINATTWFHAATTWNGSATASEVGLYINGVAKTHSGNTNGVGSYIPDTTENLLVGSFNGVDFHSGRLQWLQLWNRVLSGDEIADLYREPFAFLRQSAPRRFFAPPQRAYILATDSATLGESAGLTAAVHGYDQPTLTETPSIGATSRDGDSAGATDDHYVAASAAAADSGTTGESVGSLRLASQDSFTAGESVASTATLTTSDTIASADTAIVAAATSASDTIRSGEGSLLSTSIAGADSAAASEYSAIALADREVVSASESASIVAAATSSESVSAAEGVSIAAAPASRDSASLVEVGAFYGTAVSSADQATLTETAVPGPIAGDSASAGESVSVSAGVSQSETITYTEQITVAGSIAGRDAGTLDDAVVTSSASASSRDSASTIETAGIGISQSDSARAAETASIAAAVAMTDAGTVTTTSLIAAAVVGRDAAAWLERSRLVATPAVGPFRVVEMVWSDETTIACLWGYAVAERNDIDFTQGEDVQLDFSPVDGAEDITGWALQFTLKVIPTGHQSWAVLPALVTKTTAAGGIVITDGASGEFTVLLSDGDTDELEPGLYAFDVWRVDSGQEARIAYGDITINPPVRSIS